MASAEFFAGAVAFALCAALTPLAGHASKRLGWVDQPGPRKVHSRAVPRVGGIAIGIATLFPASLLLAASFSSLPRDQAYQFVVLLFTATVVLVTGIADDILNIPAKYKALVLAASAIALCSTGATFDAAVSKSGFIPPLGWLSWPLTILWLVSVPVAINFIDGLDGLAAGIAAAAAAVTGVGLFVAGMPLASALLVCLASALVAFLIYNTYPAKIFMGDAGSMFTGYLIAGTAVVSGPSAGFKIAYVLPAVVLCVPLIDTLLTLVRRGVLQRRSIFAAERGHVHHRMMDMGLSHRHTVWCLYGVTSIAAGVGLLAIFNAGTAVLGGLALLVPLLVGLFRASGSVRGRETLAALRRNLQIRRTSRRYQNAFEDAQLRFRDVTTFDDWWTHVVDAAQKLGLLRLRLQLINRDGSDRVLWWEREGTDASDLEQVEIRIPIRQRRDKVAPIAEATVAVFDGCLESAGQRVAHFTRLLNEHNLTLLDPSRQKLPLAAAAPAIEAQDLMSAAATPPGQPKVAIVHDFLYVYAGAERVLEQMLEVYPHADLFSVFDFLSKEDRKFIRNKPVRTSFIQRLPWARTRHRNYLPLMPLAIEQLNMDGYDIILSSSYCVAKGVISRPNQLHVCYCHTPIRFAWDMQAQYLREAKLTKGFGFIRMLKGAAARMILHYIRIWDTRSSTGVDVFLSNSHFVGRRIAKTYRRESQVLYPPVDTKAFAQSAAPREDFYLVASRMVPYKRLDLVVEAFAKMPSRRLIVVGDGPDMAKIKALAGANVSLVGHATQEQLLQYLQMAKAFVFAAEEDFGILPVEAMACGTPVIAYRAGGVCETVMDGTTGLFFSEQTTEAIIDAVERFESREDWDRELIRQRAEIFSNERFRHRLKEIIAREWRRSRQMQTAEDPHHEWEAAMRYDRAALRSPPTAIASVDEQDSEETAAADEHAR